ncbi:MAG TPA: SIR2 family protein [Candidatus Collinsella stercoripullorum]|nr:SIR2 family protein [Candidatus Collinsella stercoripullorum]
MGMEPFKLRRFTLGRNGQFLDSDGLPSEDNSKFLRNALSCGHINVLLGSGFSAGVVPTLEGRESWFRAVEEKKFESSSNDVWESALRLLKAEYFRSVMLPLETKAPASDQVDALRSLIGLVRDRGTTTIPKRINLFTTNYDPLIERALDRCSASYNDGFVGREHPRFDSSAYSRLQYEQSLFMEYKAQVATANVIKPHGSLTWRRDGEGVMYSNPGDTLQACLSGCEDIRTLSVLDSVRDLVMNDCDESSLDDLECHALWLSTEEKELLTRFEEQYDSTLCIVNPTKKKFGETVLERYYYDLLRIYANELDRNNALLLVFGFSFADEHIRDLTVRAARSNPKLLIFISCYKADDADSYEDRFADCDNVILLVPKGDMKLGLDVFARGLSCLSK